MIFATLDFGEFLSEVELELELELELQDMDSGLPTQTPRGGFSCKGHSHEDSSRTDNTVNANC